MASFTELINSIKAAFKIARPPAQSVPPPLILAESNIRPGISAMSMASAIIARMPEIGIPTGVNPDGSENINNKFIKVLCEEIVKEIKDNSLVDCSIAPGSIMATGTGGNAGGPVTVESFNTNVTSVKGILR